MALVSARSGIARSNATRSNYTPPLGPPAVPTGVAATDGTDPAKVAVSWSPVAGASSYTVYRSSSSGVLGSAIGTPTAAAFDDTTATPGVVYYYSVTAHNTAGASAASSQDAGSRMAPPPAPTGVTATDSDPVKVRVSWSAAAGATGYTVYRSTTAGVLGTALGSPGASPFDDLTGVAGVAYYYSVTATNAAGASAASSQDAGTRLLVTPAVPTGVAATDTNQLFVRVSWSAVPDAASYTVYRSSAAGVLGSSIGSTTGTALNDATAAIGVVYYYSVTATNAAGTSAASSQDAGIRPILADKIPTIVIDGVVTGPAASRRVLIASLSIRDLLNEAPNTCTFTVVGAKPVEGDSLVIYYGATDDASSRIFAGSVLRVTQVYVADNPQHVTYQVEGIDWSWLLNARLVTARYTGQDATAIATDLVSRFAPAGFTSSGVAAGLPTVDEISFTNAPFMDALAQLAGRIGGYAACDYFKNVGLWIDSTLPDPMPLTPAHPTLREFVYIRDLSQVVTRAIVVGGGAAVLCDLIPTDIAIPVESAEWYSSSGGVVEVGPQRVTYGGVRPGGVGAMTGIPAAPSVAPTATISSGAGLPNGTYKYAYSFVTAAGETIPSPLATAICGAIGNPTTAPTLTDPGGGNGSLVVGKTYYVRYYYAYYDGTNWPPPVHTAHSPGSSRATPSRGSLTMRAPMVNDARINKVVFGRATASGGPYYYDGHFDNIPGAGTNAIDATQSDSALTAMWQLANTNTAGFNKVALSGIAVGPSGTTARKVYRTIAGGAQLKLLTTIADNTTTTIANDTTADASLGANAPTVDTSGLSMVTGQINAGATTIPVTSSAPFAPAPGWARLGNQLVWYTGLTPTALTGIPATGHGALLVSVPYGHQIDVPPQLTGIPASGAGAIALPIEQGEQAYVIVVANDTTAQGVLAAATGGDGIAEAVLEDHRISLAEASSRAAALLEQRAYALESVAYTVRDPASKSGTTIAVDLPAPTAVTGSYKVQDVSIGQFDGRNRYPVYSVRASSQRFSFEDLLRRQRQAPKEQP